MRTTRSARRLAASVFLFGAALTSSVAAPAAAQSATASATADPVFSRPVAADTRSAMAESFGRLSEKPVVSGTFVQSKRIKRLGRYLVSKGQFLFSAKDGVYWKLTSPYPSTIVMTATKLVQISDSGETSVIDSKDNAVFKRIAGTMQAVFSGSLEALEADFKVYFQGGPSSWRLGLVPKEKSVRDIVASLVVEGDETIRKLTLTEGAGDSVLYAFATTRRADELEDSERGLFVF